MKTAPYSAPSLWALGSLLEAVTPPCIVAFVQFAALQPCMKIMLSVKRLYYITNWILLYNIAEYTLKIRY